MSYKKYLIFTVYLSFTLVAVVSSWLVRGVYDELRWHRGDFYVINATENNKTIKLTFPSGESRNANIHPGKNSHFIVFKTGEGAISVKSDGQEIGKVGYVTSLNPPIIIVVMDDKALFALTSMP